MSSQSAAPKHYRRIKHLHVLLSPEEEHMLEAIRSSHQGTSAQVIRGLIRERFDAMNKT